MGKSTKKERKKRQKRKKERPQERKIERKKERQKERKKERRKEKTERKKEIKTQNGDTRSPHRGHCILFRAVVSALPAAFPFGCCVATLPQSGND